MLSEGAFCEGVSDFGAARKEVQPLGNWLQRNRCMKHQKINEGMAAMGQVTWMGWCSRHLNTSQNKNDSSWKKD